MRAGVVGALLGTVLSLTLVAQSQTSIYCGRGLSNNDCRFATETVRTVLQQLNDPVEDWRWVIVPARDWKTVSASLGSKSTGPAFTLLNAHATYIEDAVVFRSQRVDEVLQAYTKRTGLSRLRWILAHESGHILCSTHDERVAEDAAGRLEAGSEQIEKGLGCR